MRAAAETWTGEWWIVGGGGTVWDGMAADPEAGTLRWHYQTTPADDWDYTATQPLVLLDLTIDGRERGGAHNWHPMSWSPETGLVYLPARNNISFFEKEEGFEYTAGVWNTGTVRGDDAGPRPERPPLNARDGRELWGAELDGRPGSPVTYSAGGRQYVVIGSGQSSGRALPRVRAFALPDGPAR